MTALRRPETILVVEDDENLRSVISETLDDNGYRVVATGSPDEAILYAKKEAFDLVLADVRMAGSTDGVGAVESIKEFQPYIRSVIMTGFASLDVPLRAAKIKADDYLLKGDRNFGLRELLRVVRRTLDRENDSTQNLLDFFSSPGRLDLAPAESWVNARLPELERERESFLKSFFLLLRPGHLSPEQALPLWQKLETVEKALAAARPEEFTHLVRLYSDLESELVAGVSAGVKSTPTPKKSFDYFYSRVRHGQVNFGQFQRAAQLRCESEARLESVESYALYHWLWAPPDDSEIASFIGRNIGAFTLTELHSDHRPAKCSYLARHKDGRPESYLVEVFPITEETKALLSKATAYSLREQYMGFFFCLQTEPLEQKLEPPSTLLASLFPLGQKSEPQRIWDVLSPLLDLVSQMNAAGQLAGPLSLYIIAFEEGRIEFRRGPIPSGLEKGSYTAPSFDFLNYQAPEPRASLSEQSDVYSLGALTLALCSERRSSLSTFDRIHRYRTRHTPLFDFPNDFEEALTPVLLRMLHTQPAQRPASVLEAKQALEPIFSGRALSRKE